MEDNLKELCTEQRNPRSENIDQMSTFDILMKKIRGLLLPYKIN